MKAAASEDKILLSLTKFNVASLLRFAHKYFVHIIFSVFVCLFVCFCGLNDWSFKKLVNFVSGQSLFSLAPHLDSRNSRELIIKYLMISRTIFASVATILSYSVQTITACKFRAQNKFGTVACCAGRPKKF